MPNFRFQRMGTTGLVLVFLTGFTAANVTLAQTGAEHHASALPKEVRHAIKRAKVCHYLSGELGGDNAELRRLAIKYQDHAQVLARIKAAE